jgi:hypothetical protein
VVWAGFAEGDQFWLIDDQTGARTALPAPPQFGPDGRTFITINSDLAYGDPGVGVWRLGDGRVTTLWRQRPDSWAPNQTTRLVSWTEPGRIVLDRVTPASAEHLDIHQQVQLKRVKTHWRFEDVKP